MPEVVQRGKGYEYAMKAATVAVLVALFFVVRSTGALQQTMATERPSSETGSPDLVGFHRRLGEEGADGGQSTKDPNTSVNATSKPDGSSVGQTPGNDSSGGNPTSGTSPNSADNGTQPSTSEPSANGYQNGTYYAEGSYNTPNGAEKIGISLSISDGVVIGTNATNMGRNPNSKSYQNDFIAHYASFVIGKNIDDLNLGKVSGSSLTPIGFNNAVANIESQAS